MNILSDTIIDTEIMQHTQCKPHARTSAQDRVGGCGFKGLR